MCLLTHQLNAAEPSDPERYSLSLVPTLLVQHSDQVLEPQRGAGTNTERPSVDFSFIYEPGGTHFLIFFSQPLTSTSPELVPPGASWSWFAKDKKSESVREVLRYINVSQHLLIKKLQVLDGNRLLKHPEEKGVSSSTSDRNRQDGSDRTK